MKKKKWKIVLLVGIVLYGIVFVTDYTLSKLAIRPIFSIPVEKNSNHVEYFGLGYRVTIMKTIEKRKGYFKMWSPGEDTSIMKLD